MKEQEVLTLESREYHHIAVTAELKHFAAAMELVGSEPFKTKVQNWLEYTQTRARLGLKQLRGAEISPSCFELSYQTLNGFYQRILLLAQLTAGSVLFEESTIPLQQDYESTEMYFDRLVEEFVRYLTALGTANGDLDGILFSKLHRLDVVRTAQLLKLLGLLSYDPETTYQLGLGAADGGFDRLVFHSIPIFEVIRPGGALPEHLSLGIELATPRHIVVVDNDQVYQALHQRLQAVYPGRVIAITDDIHTVLPNISERVRAGEVEPRNLITALKVDPRMIPDIPDFFRLISGTIADQAQLICTIGQGNTNEEFRQRKLLMEGIFSYLKGIGLSPVRLILSSGISYEEHLLNPTFGEPSYTNYEILTCQIEKAKIQ